jgi:hypothetical protein
VGSIPTFGTTEKTLDYERKKEEFLQRYPPPADSPALSVLPDDSQTSRNRPPDHGGHVATRLMPGRVGLVAKEVHSVSVVSPH